VTNSERLLRAVAAGEQGTEELARSLAELDIEARGAQRAMLILQGGPLALPRAVDMATEILRSASAPLLESATGETSRGGDQ
jgi:hypothetical protein